MVYSRVLCVFLPVAGEESHRDEGGDGRLRESVLRLSVPEDPQPAGGNDTVTVSRGAEVSCC